jgi:tetratricopeptide (TPR) repeat protein
MNARTFLTRVPATVLLVLGILIVQSGAVYAQAPTNPEHNFDFLWKTFDVNYALFKAKHIDWQALYNTHRPQVTSRTTDSALFAIISRMLGHLNDNHVQFRSTTPERAFSAGYLWDLFGKAGMAKFRALMSQRPVPEKYFKGPLKETGNAFFAYGWLEDKIGYFHFKGFVNLEMSAKAIDEIMAEFKDADALIVDVRRNGGGDDRVGKLIADRFADKKRLYMTTQERNGPNHSDFDPKRHFFVEPGGPIQFTKTVILLTNRLSVSAAENFTLAMRILPHVTVVGDFTSGCFADMRVFQLPNGWSASYSMNLFLDQNGMCWEGIGVPPDIKVSCDYSEAVPENDPVLETAISLIRSGKLSLQDERENIRPTQSLVSLLENDIISEGIDKATRKFNIRKASGPDGAYYLDFYEMLALAQKWFAAGKFESGKAVLTLTSRLFPEMATTYSMLGMAYMKQNKKTEAHRALEKAVALEQKKYLPLARQFSEFLSDVLTKEYLSGGIGALDRQYVALKEQYPLLVTERLLNNLGYSFLNVKLTEPAIEILQLNVRKFPQSANAYDSLGEAYMNAGDKERAIENYEKSLKLNPNNAGGMENLKKLRGEK